MNTPTPSRNLPRLLTALVCLAAAPSASVAQPPPAPNAPVRDGGATRGVVTGMVINEASQSVLHGAAVALESDPRVAAVSEADGSFRLERVPSGPQTLIVNYTGLNPGRARVDVSAGGGAGPVVVRLTSDLYKMAAFEVSGVREGQAMAVNTQRMADNVKNVVATDAFGNVADSNLGNLLVKLPGIGGERDEVVVYNISIRGIDANLNSIAVDGTRLSAATTRNGERAFEIDKISSNSIESIEVIKAATPDMDADSIGGSVNLKTKSAFDRTGRAFEYSIGTNYFLPRHVAYPSASISYSDIFGQDRRLGIAFTGSFNRTLTPRTATRQGYTTPLLTAVAPITDFQITEDDILLTRAGGGMKADYKLGPTASVYLNVMYNNFEDNMRHHRVQLGRGTGTAVTLDDVATTITNGQFDHNLESRVRRVNTLRLSAGGKLSLQNYQIDYDANFAPSVAFERRQSFILRFIGANYVIDRSHSRNYPSFTRVGGVDVENYDNGFNSSMGRPETRAKDKVHGAQVNVKRSFDTVLPLSVKVGARYRSQEVVRDVENSAWTYVGPDGVAGTNPATRLNDDNFQRFRGDGHTILPLEGRYPLREWIDLLPIHQELAVHPELFAFNRATTIQNGLVNDGIASEDIYAGYMQGHVRYHRLSLLAGTRFEKTDTAGTGPVTDNKQTDPLLRYGGKVTKSGGYHNWFPSAHLRFDLTKNTQARASYSTGIGRPSYTNLMPITTVTEASSSITQNNPSLKPQRAKNYDLSFEHYFKSVGLISVGGFQKDITDYIFNVRQTVGSGADNGFDGDYVGFDLNTKTNGGWARIRGLEFNYQQQFTFLPGWLGGFGAFANYTRLQVRGTFTGTVVVDKLANFSPLLMNGGLSFIRSRVTARAQLNHVGERLTSYNVNPGQRNYQEPRSTVDVSVKYRVTTTLSLYCDAFNVFNERNIVFTGIGTRPNNSQIYGVFLSAGVTGRF